MCRNGKKRNIHENNLPVRSLIGRDAQHHKKASFYKKILSFVFIMLFLASCGSQIPRTIIPHYEKKGIRLVALMPVKNKTDDTKAAEVLRNAILEDLYFKGYPKIPLNIIDAKLLEVYGSSTVHTRNNLPPEAVGEILGVDAVMYCTLERWKTSFWVICAPTTVSASFELRSAKTGETLWSTNYKVVKRDYDVTSKGLEMKSMGSCELAAQEVVEKALSTLPNGPDYLGSPPKKESFLGLW